MHRGGFKMPRCLALVLLLATTTLLPKFIRPLLLDKVKFEQPPAGKQQDKESISWDQKGKSLQVLRRGRLSLKKIKLGNAVLGRFDDNNTMTEEIARTCQPGFTFFTSIQLSLASHHHAMGLHQEHIHRVLCNVRGSLSCA